jgi:hypothetical protein
VRFAHPRTIVLWTVAVAALLYAIDAALGPKALDGAYAPPDADATDAPTLQLWMHAVDCPGCLDPIAEPLLDLAFLGDPVLARRPATAGGVAPEESTLGATLQRVDVPILDLATFDWTLVRATLSTSGIAIDHAHVSGLDHYRVEVTTPRVSGPSNVSQVTDALSASVASARPRGFFAWLDSVVAQEGKVTFYPRLDAPADLVEVDGALFGVGYVGQAVTLVRGD